jgi:hypothetical protein
MINFNLSSPNNGYSNGGLYVGLQTDSKISDFIRDPIRKIIKII